MKLVKIRPAGAILLALLAAALLAIPVLAAPTVEVYPARGPVGTTIMVIGTGFWANTSVEIYFPDTSIYKTSAPTNDSGYFGSPSFTIGNLPAGAKTVYVRYVGSTSIVATGTFTVIPTITLNKTTDYVGANITVDGTGFAASQNVALYFDEEQVGTITSNALGIFNGAIITIPASARGSHTIKGQDAGGNYNTAEFITKPAMTTNPDSSKVGDKITVKGTGFTANENIILLFDDATMVTTPPQVTTNSKGSFSLTFSVPVSASGAHQIKASDGSNTESRVLTVLAGVSLNPTSGYVGSKITANGSGFQANWPVSILFDGQLAIAITSDTNGGFGVSITVPVRTSGVYKVRANDGTNTAEADFAILTSATISPLTSAADPGYVDTEVSLSGIGFMVNKTATISYDGQQVATATVGVDGKFSATFKAPASRGGSHNVTVTDGTTTKQFTFVMESTPPPVPAPLKPEMGTKTKRETYFDWQEVADLSGVTYTLQVATTKDFATGSIVLEKKGLTASEYTVTPEERLKSVSQQTPYYWHVKAVDGASNESEWSGTGSFSAGFILTFSQPVIYSLLGLGALLLFVLGFWLGRRTSYY